MKSGGYYFCDACEELASGPRCEHCNATAPAVRWVHAPLHHARPAETGSTRSGPKPISQERARELWQQLHATLKF